MPDGKQILGAVVVGTAGAVAYLYFASRRWARRKQGPSTLPPKVGNHQCPYVAATVTELFVHPVKSCKGYAVESAELTPTGIRYDREWAIVRRRDSKVMTLRELPCLVLLRATITSTAKGASLRLEPVAGDSFGSTAGAFTVEAVDHGDATNSSQAPRLHETTLSPAHFVEVNLWGLVGTLRDEGVDVAAYISAFVSSHVKRNDDGDDDDNGSQEETSQPPYFLGRIVKMRNPLENIKYQEGIPNPEQRVALQDFTALQLISRDSLRDLEYRVRAEDTADNPALNTLQSERFRPNIVVSGSPPFDEDHWDELHVVSPKKADALHLKVTKLTTRCAVPTVLIDGSRHPRSQPTKYLREHHAATHLSIQQLVDSCVPSEDAVHKPIFGLNISAKGVVAPSTTISLGDTILVTRRVDRTPCFKQ